MSERSVEIRKKRIKNWIVCVFGYSRSPLLCRFSNKRMCVRMYISEIGRIGSVRGQERDRGWRGCRAIERGIRPVGCLALSEVQWSVSVK